MASSLFVRLGLQSRDYVKGLKDAGRRTQQFKQQTTALGNALKSLKGQVVALAGAYGVMQLGRAIVMTGANFERSMGIVGGVMRATEKEFKALRKSARLMGETTEWSATESSNALKFLGMAGFKATQAIKALPGVLDLATAGNLDLGRAADIATNALTAFGLEVKELERINDIFVATITRSNTNIEEMADAFRYSAPLAKAFGYEIEELSALIGVLASAGVKQTQAGTQLAFALQKSEKAAKELGMEGAKLGEVLKGINREAWSNTTIMKVFGERSGKAVLILKDLIPELEELETALRNSKGEAKKLAEIMRTDVIGSFKIFWSTIESIGIDIYDVFRDDIKNAVDIATATFRTFTAGIKAIFEGWKLILDPWVQLILDAFKKIEEGFDRIKRIFVDPIAGWTPQGKLQLSIEELLAAGAGKPAPKVTVQPISLEAQLEAYGLRELEKQSQRIEALTQRDLLKFEMVLATGVKSIESIGTQLAITALRELEKESQSILALTQRDLQKFEMLVAETRHGGYITWREELQETLDANAEAMEHYFKKVEEREQKHAEIKKRIQDAAVMGMLANWAFAFHHLAQKSREAFAIFKAFSIAQTIIKTFEAAQGAYSALAGIPYVGPALGIAAAAAAIAAGMARVSKIAAMKPTKMHKGGTVEGPEREVPVILERGEVVTAKGEAEIQVIYLKKIAKSMGDIAFASGQQLILLHRIGESLSDVGFLEISLREIMAPAPISDFLIGGHLGDFLSSGDLEDFLGEGPLANFLNSGDLEDFLGEGFLVDFLSSGNLEDFLGEGDIDDFLTGTIVFGDFITGSISFGDFITGNVNFGDFITGSLNFGDFITGSISFGDFITGSVNFGDFVAGTINIDTAIIGSINIGDYVTGEIDMRPYAESIADALQWWAIHGQRREERQYGGLIERGRPYTVGEAGPETFIPNQSGRISPNADGGDIHIHLEIDGREISHVVAKRTEYDNELRRTFKRAIG